MSEIKDIFSQFVLFSISGISGTACLYVILVFSVEILDQEPILPSLVGVIVGSFINYILNYKFTFKSSKPHRETISKFMTIAAIGVGINTLLMYIFIQYLLVYYLLAQIATTGILLIWNFTLNKIWTFSEI